jgi:putative ABC transport system permease protein
VFRQFHIHPLQSILIVLAVALGVAVITTVIAYLQVSQRLEDSARNQLAFRELNVIRSIDDSSYFSQSNPLPRKIGAVSDFTLGYTPFSQEDLQAIKAAAPSVDYAYVPREDVYIELDESKNKGRLHLARVALAYLEAAKIDVDRGSIFTFSDFLEKRQVMLITSRGAKLLGIEGDPLGQTFTDKGIKGEFLIIGQLPPDDSQDALHAIIPNEARLFWVDEPNSFKQLTFAVNNVNKLDDARVDIESYVQKTWGDGVLVKSQNLSSVNAKFRFSVVFTTIFASISLIIASLNIMNLFIARVLRHQRDVAIFRSLGASQTNVLISILTEALALGLLGGLVGIVAGYGLTNVFNNYVKRITEGTWPMATPSPLTFLIGFMLALLMSVLFGLYPALTASRVRITDALKEG